MKFLIMTILGLSIFINIILGIRVVTQQSNPQTSDNTNDAKQFPYLSKRIFMEDQNDLLINFVLLRTMLREFVTLTEASISIYFEYLPTGVSIGINDRDELVTASLIKVPIAMAVVNEVNKGNLSYDTELTVEKEHLSPTFGDLWKKGVGTKITVEEALQLSLTKSDNTAAVLLHSQLPPGSLNYIFDSLDLPNAKTGNDVIITAKGYSSIMSSLYFSSSLPYAGSQKILEMLTKSTFNNQITAGVSEDIPVAHKSGVHETTTLKDNVYHDCGIVYVPKRPYILCIMTQGVDREKANSLMKDTSSIIYGYIDSVIPTGNKPN